MKNKAGDGEGRGNEGLAFGCVQPEMLRDAQAEMVSGL